ncbi:MAG: site-2 protease family protein [Candidatus Lloydbacteria bacterium CG22_combo_CG10-13_8_21_14_all_47_15]|uniref:Site-2 protease family protein n=1 Tax=Candidatus Lloydbacteria bacterium CG22_combo_CG10-13_8_21_14_all_47_15 TaxID=1974635 RepID=A0A2H0CUY8_9BACT|nr:MAG: site-2 protease family protein [Candidatus Lloydbacteria bacterium CG22_combo_CG10-13_8_21_14_all_47_15]
MLDPISFVFSIAVLIMSVVIHELSHGYAAETLGDPTARIAGRLTVNPLKHLDMVGSFIVPVATYLLGGFILGWAKPVPYNPYNLSGGRWGPALVAAAGPFANIILAVIFSVILRVFGGSFDPAVAGLVSLIVLINLVLAVFNIVPVPPLDGSKILFAALPIKWRGLEIFLERNWLLFVVLLILFLWEFIVPLVFFLFRLLTGVGV